MKNLNNKIFEGAPTINNSLNYWLSKGKTGKDCMIYFHNDLDGIMSAIVTRDYLWKNRFNIKGYGVIDYQTGWKYIEINERYINIALDYAEDMEGLDVYIDHHGQFTSGITYTEDWYPQKKQDTYKRQKSQKSVKTETASAFEGICIQLGIPRDELILNVIDMVDGAKYQFYDVDIETILDFNLSDIKKTHHPTLFFAGAFNQLIKRGDYRTLIEVAHNATLSVKNIFLMFKLLFPANNLDKTGQEKDFVTDAKIRLNTMINRTRGKNEKEIFYKQKRFHDKFWDQNNFQLKLDGYQIIGKLAFVPTGTWANALRARAIIKQDARNNEKLKKHKLYFVLLQYGASLQIADLINIKEIPPDDLPVLKTGMIVDDLGEYTNSLLEGMRKHLNYNKDITISGGHPGIGNITNIVGQYLGSGNLNLLKWIDIFKNKIIADLSGIPWSLQMQWDQYKEAIKTEEHDINEKVLMVNEIRTLKK